MAELNATIISTDEPSTPHFNDELTNTNHESASDAPVLVDTSGDGVSLRKRSKSPEEVNHPGKEKGMTLRSSKRTKGESYKFLRKGKINKKQRSKLSKNHIGQSSNQPKRINSKQNIKYCQNLNTKMSMSNSLETSSALSVPNSTENLNIASTSKTEIGLGSSSIGTISAASNIKGNKRKQSQNRLSKTENVSLNNSKSSTIEETQDANQEQFEEELKCSICSEIFINAVTLNCSHSFCQYCITVWRKEHSTCPICRQTISSQNATLVLDKCVERVLLSSKEEIKKHRNEVIDYREKNKQPEPQTGNTNITSSTGTNNINIPLFFDDSSDEEDYYNDDDYFDDDDDYYSDQYDEDYYDEVQFFDGEGEYDVADGGEYDEVEEEAEEGEEEQEEVEDDDYDEEDSLENSDNYYDEEEEEEGDEEQEEEEEESDWDNQVCFNCGQEGHFARHCPTAIPYNGVPGAFYGGYGSCFQCNQEGHWANGCPN